MQLDKNKRKILRLAKATDLGIAGVVDDLNNLEDKVDSNFEEVVSSIDSIQNNIEEVKKMEGPAGKDGVDGKDGINGKDGKDGKNGKDGKDGAKGDTTIVEKVIEKIERIVEQPIELVTVKEIENKDTGEQIIEKINTDKKSLIKRNKIEGLEERLIAIGERKIGGGLGAVSPTPTPPTLQEVTDNGSTTTNSITAQSFITTGGTSADFVKGDGSLDSNTYLTEATELKINIRNETGSTITKGKVVYVSGFNNLPLVTLADNTVDNKEAFIAIVTANIAHEANGVGVLFGAVDMDTDAIGNVGDNLYLSTSGNIVNAPPTTGAVVPIGVLTIKENNGRIQITKPDHQEYMTMVSGIDAIVRMGDSVGANKVSYRNYANTEVASLNSLGNIIVGQSLSSNGSLLLTSKSDPLTEYPVLLEGGYCEAVDGNSVVNIQTNSGYLSLGYNPNAGLPYLSMSPSSGVDFTSGIDVNGQTRISGTAGVVGDIGDGSYTLSIQNNYSDNWLEMLNSGGVGKGAFFGLTGDSFEQYNYQGGPINFYTAPTASDAVLRMSISNAGTVTIGGITTASHFQGGSGSASSPSLSFSTDTNTGFFRYNADQIAVSTGGALRGLFDNAYFSYNHPIRSANGTAALPAFSFSSDTNNGMYLITTDTIAFSTNSTERVRISSTGLVGIGVATTPTNRLQVLSTTTPQIRNSYSTTQYSTWATNSAGNTTIDVYGTSPRFSVSIAGGQGFYMSSDFFNVSGNYPKIHLSGADTAGYLGAGTLSTDEFGLYGDGGDEQIATYDAGLDLYYYFNGSFYGNSSGITFNTSIADTSGNYSMNTNSRYLYDTDGTTIAASWGNGAGISSTNGNQYGALNSVGYGVVGSAFGLGAGGYFDDQSSNIVILADGTYSINATGNAYFSGSVGFGMTPTSAIVGVNYGTGYVRLGDGSGDAGVFTNSTVEVHLATTGSDAINIVTGQFYAPYSFGYLQGLLVNETSPYDNSCAFETYGKGGFNDGTYSAYFASGSSAADFNGQVSITNGDFYSMGHAIFNNNGSYVGATIETTNNGNGALYATDGTNVALLSNGTAAGSFTNTTFSTYLAGTYAGSFGDGTNQVYLSDLTYAINSSGNVRMQGLSSGTGPPATILTNFNLYVDTVTGLVYVD